ncbi:MAG: hypothetical protein FGM18_01775 [Burkholderiaceae bacterium]|nr:hypothetical protein [Burkholderiaceae bacterium]
MHCLIQLPLSTALVSVLLLAPVTGWADDDEWELGVVLDVAQTSKKLALGYRDKNIGMGHSDLYLRGPMGKFFGAEAMLAAHTVDGRLEHHTDRFLISTRALPAGLSAVVGRLASQIGAINAQHPHADDFSERPLLYRGFLGSHWVDDGLRLNWTAPTPFDLQFGLEAFSGQRLIEEAQSPPTIGVQTFSLKTGGDLGTNNNWRFGISALNNRRQAVVHEHVGVGETHKHVHGAEFSGRRMWLADLGYSWAPDGRPEDRQLRLTWEYASVSRIHPQSTSLRHAGTTVGAVWRFRSAWEVGARTDWLRVNKPELHDDDGDGVAESLEFSAARLREHALMIAYRPSHMQTYRLQVSQQRVSGANGMDVFPAPAGNAIQFQVVIGFTALGEHAH